MLLLLSSVHAKVIVSIGEEVEQPRAGTFHRVFPREEGGWWFVNASGGGVAIRMTEDLELTNEAHGLTDAPQKLNDLGVVRCPDQGFLVVASASDKQPDDIGWAWRYDKDWKLLARSEISAGRDEGNYNDITLVCGDTWVAAGQNGRQTESFLLVLDQDLKVVEEAPLERGPMMTGSSMLEEDGELVAVGYRDYMAGDLNRVRWSADLSLLEEDSVELPPQGEVGWWSQGLLRVEGGWLVARMSRADDGSFLADEGNVWLHVLDDDFQLVESAQITDYSAPIGCMRPWLALKGDTLVVSYDAEVRSRYRLVTLDIGQILDPDPEDTGDPQDTGEDTGGPQETGDPDDTGPGDDTDTPDSPDDQGGCGCTSQAAPASGLLLGLGLLLAGVRRRR